MTLQPLLRGVILITETHLGQYGPDLFRPHILELTNHPDILAAIEPPLEGPFNMGALTPLFVGDRSQNLGYFLQKNSPAYPPG